ncbi:hypothetical protein PAPYR_7628 [Paratrimastix pyriformis]|uniref:Uncharacterized protein n=1 Tax=Paratrimastix pyriformis TaxID=342808 RepID=A0ABQ8UCH7_9EUKA|nr:hypothetical protein PAPYR_7628 [Paratrimastix pyriformis]
MEVANYHESLPFQRVKGMILGAAIGAALGAAAPPLPGSENAVMTDVKIPAEKVTAGAVSLQELPWSAELMDKYYVCKVANSGLFRTFDYVALLLTLMTQEDVTRRYHEALVESFLRTTLSYEMGQVSPLPSAEPTHLFSNRIVGLLVSQPLLPAFGLRDPFLPAFHVWATDMQANAPTNSPLLRGALMGLPHLGDIDLVCRNAAAMCSVLCDLVGQEAGQCAQLFSAFVATPDSYVLFHAFHSSLSCPFDPSIQLTHADPRCSAACCALATLTARLIAGQPVEAACLEAMNRGTRRLREARKELAPTMSRLLGSLRKGIREGSIASGLEGCLCLLAPPCPPPVPLTSISISHFATAFDAHTTKKPR